MTGGELIADALRILTLLESGQAPTADQVADHQRTLNEIMAEWAANGRELGFTPLAAATDVINVPDWALRGVKYALCLALSIEYGLEPDLRLIALAEKSADLIAKQCSEDTPIDTLDMPFGRRTNRFDINSGI